MKWEKCISNVTDMESTVQIDVIRGNTESNPQKTISEVFH